MATIDNSPPAFPCPAERHGDSAGLSLRDYFAAATLQGWIASYAGTTQVPSAKQASELAYEIADAMLKAREGK